ncbi:hypothetical protein L1887_38426 [Cichorium endivia]|nr:hypothetical protein L1887_38426 [Cichorium endivia]
MLIILYFHTNWSLAFVVVVAESNWAFAHLTRSSYLVKGVRSVSFSMLLYFGVFLGCTVWVNSNAMSNQTYELLPMIVGSSMLMWFLLWSTDANIVLCTYCKACHGELALEIADWVAHNYINDLTCLPMIRSYLFNRKKSRGQRVKTEEISVSCEETHLGEASCR